MPRTENEGRVPGNSHHGQISQSKPSPTSTTKLVFQFTSSLAGAMNDGKAGKAIPLGVNITLPPAPDDTMLSPPVKSVQTGWRGGTCLQCQHFWEDCKLQPSLAT